MLGLIAFGTTGCKNENLAEPTIVYTEAKFGEYKYENTRVLGTYYGARVAVGVEDGKVTYIVVMEDTEELTNLSAESSRWTAEKRANWLDNQNVFAQKFIGMSVEDINAIEVTTGTSGDPTEVEGTDVIAGATVSSGRLILAIQDAITE